jgi:hypothetical protein
MEDTYKSVHDLLTHATGTSSAFENAELLGKVQMVFASNHAEEKGTLLLYDINENKYIPCLVDYFHPEYFNRNISIQKWTYIYSPDCGICFVEFEFKHVYLLASDTPLLLDVLSADTVMLGLSQRQSIPLLAGQVTAISSLYEQSDEACFLLELTTGTLLFQGEDAIMYHRLFQLDWHYCFTNTTTIVTTTMTTHKRKNENIKIVQFQSPKSKVYIIKRLEYDKMMMDTDDVKPATMHMEGTITRVIDIVFGLYELDEHHVICLYDSPQYWPTVFPLRIGVKLALHHVHMLKLSVDKRHPFIRELWPEYDTEKYSIIATCLRSHISVISFPNHWDFDDTTWGNQEDLYIECVSHRYKLSQALCELALSFMLQQNFTTYPSNTPAINKKQHTDSFDLVQNFMLHTSRCQLIPKSSLRIPFYSTLKEINDKLLHPALETVHDNNAMAGGSDLFLSTLVALQHAWYKETTPFLGIIDVGMDGKLYVMDKTQKFKLVLPEKSKTSIVVGGLYEFSRFRLVNEDLSFNSGDNQRCSLAIEYIVCNEDDLVLRGGPLTDIVHYHNLAELNSRGDQQLVGFYDKSLELNSKVFYIRSIHPLTMVNNDHELSMECGVLVTVYNVVESGLPVEFNSDNANAAFLFSSLHRSLQHMVHLVVGGWYVITGLDSPAEFNRYDVSHEAVIIKIEQQKPGQASTLSPIYKPKSQFHKSLQLDHKPRRVYSVAEAIAQLRQGNLHDNVFISIKGVIVTKAWDSGFDNNKPPPKGNERKLFLDLGIGTGEKNRELFFKLRQTDGLDSISVYMTVSKQYYPLGLLPGAKVIFHQVILRKSAFNIYIKTFGSCTYEIVNPNHCTPRTDVVDTTVHEHQTLTSFYGTQSPHERSIMPISKIFATVNKIFFLELKWVCSNCGSVIRFNDCYNICQNAPRIFYATCLAEVSDGTANMIVDIEGERLVFRLLALSQNQIVLIKKAVMQDILCYKQFKSTDKDEILVQFVESCRQRSHWIYGKAMPKGPAVKAKEGPTNLLGSLGLSTTRIYANDQPSLTCQYADIKYKAVEVEQVDSVNTTIAMMNSL